MLTQAAILTPRKQGKARVLTCRFHGWAYSCEGRCIRIKQEKEAFGDEEFDRSSYDLKVVPRTESYRGFVFGSLEENVPPLREALAAAAGWIDLMVEQSPDGLEVVPGSSTYTIHGNWKMQIENSVDGHHVSTVHRVFANTMRNREERDGLTGMARTEGGRITGKVPQAPMILETVIWRYGLNTQRPSEGLFTRKRLVGGKFLIGQSGLDFESGKKPAVFPNVALMDNPSTQIRRVRPISPDRTEVTVYCIAHVGEDDEARAARLRKFEDFYLTAGMATSDDMAALRILISVVMPAQPDGMTSPEVFIAWLKGQIRWQLLETLSQ